MNDSTMQRRKGDSAAASIDGGKISRIIGDSACQTVLRSLCKRQERGVETTFWDLQQLTGLPLHKAFAAVRTLEFDKDVRIDDNPSDPFGAVIVLLDRGLKHLAQSKAA